MLGGAAIRTALGVGLLAGLGISLGFGLGIGLAAVAGAAGPPRAQAQQYFAAISVSPSGALGWGFDYPHRDAAAEAALENCERYADECKIIAVIRNGCSVVAASDDGYWGASSHSRGEAQRMALEKCRDSLFGGRNCKIVRWVCTTNSGW